jgi:hypothetical protein
MDNKEFYKLVQQMRTRQDWNKGHHKTVETVIRQWELEFLVDNALNEIGAAEKQIPKIPATFQTFSDQYCPN